MIMEGFGLPVKQYSCHQVCGNQEAGPEDASFNCCCYYFCCQCGPNGKGVTLELMAKSSSSFLIVWFLESTVKVKDSRFPTFLIEVALATYLRSDSSSFSWQSFLKTHPLQIANTQFPILKPFTLYA